MAGDKLNLSLDEILTERRKGARVGRRGGRRAVPGSRTMPVAPIGGVRKSARPTKAADKPTIPTGPSKSGESKALISNLPLDVDENNLKEFYISTVGPIKKVLLSYGPNGKSRGIATIIFAKSNSAAIAVEKTNGLRIDGKVLRVEVVVGASGLAAPPPAKTLEERITKPKGNAKSAPKSTTKPTPKPATETKTKTGRDGKARGGKRGRNAGRGKPKTAEELDAEMVDYFDGGANGPSPADGEIPNGGAVQPPSGGDTGMEDEIL